MAQIRPLAHAPVTEAIFDFQVVLPPDVSPDRLKELHTRISGDYPEAQERRRWRSKLQFSIGVPGSAQNEDLGISGFIFKSRDGKQAVQYRLDGFSFSRLNPYTNWEECRAEAKKLWGIYCSIGVTRITRVATRFINVINVPTPVEGGLESIITGLPAAPELELTLHSFLNRIQISDPRAGFSAIVTQALQAPPNPLVASILLDIDAFKEGNFDAPFDSAWTTLDQLRNFKNQLFFNLVTEKATKLFD